MDENGHPAAQVYVRFGPRPTQEVPVEWAERMLTALKERNEALFGKLLTAAALDAGQGRGGACSTRHGGSAGGR